MNESNFENYGEVEVEQCVYRHVQIVRQQPVAQITVAFEWALYPGPSAVNHRIAPGVTLFASLWTKHSFRYYSGESRKTLPLSSTFSCAPSVQKFLKNLLLLFGTNSRIAKVKVFRLKVVLNSKQLFECNFQRLKLQFLLQV